MQRGPITRIITEQTCSDAPGEPWLYHHVRWSFETTAGRPTTTGVYHVPDTEWGMLQGLLKEVSRRALNTAPRALTNYINGVAASAGWSAAP